MSNEATLTTEQRRHQTSQLPKGPAAALQTLAWVRLLSAKNLAIALAVHSVTARRYLRSLHKRKLAKRDSYSFADLGGTGWLYTLSPLGARRATKLLGYPVPPPRRTRPRTALVEHRLDTTSDLCGLIAALTTRMVSVHTGKSLRTHFVHGSGDHRYFPDAYFAFRVGDGAHSFLRHVFLEVDRATETSSILREKLRNLHSYYASGHYQADFKTKRLVVLFTVPSEGRLPAVIKAVQAVRPCVRVFVALHAHCSDPDSALTGWVDCLTSSEIRLMDRSSSTEDEQE